MTVTYTVTSKSWANNIISFNVQYVTNQYSEPKLLEWSVGGVIKGSLVGSAFGGGGTTQFSYSSTANSVTVVFKLYRYLNGIKDAYMPGENENVVFTKAIPPSTPVLSSQSILDQIYLVWNIDPNATQYNIELTTPSNSNFVSMGGDFTPNAFDSTKYGIQYNMSSDGTYQFRIRAKNPLGYSEYSNITTLTKNVNSDNLLNWTCSGIIKQSITNGSMPSKSIRIDSVNGGIVSIRVNDVNGNRSTTTTVQGMDYYCNNLYTIYDPNNLTKSTVTPTVPITPVLSVTPIDKYNFLLSWTGNITDQFNLERATSIQDYSSLFGDLQDTDNQVQITIQPVTETYYYRIRTKNSVGYSAYSNVITVVNTEPIIEPPEENILLRYNLDPQPPTGFEGSVLGVLNSIDAVIVKNYVITNNLPLIKALDNTTSDPVDFDTAQQFIDRLINMINQDIQIPTPSVDDYVMEFSVGTYKLVNNVNELVLQLSTTKVSDEWTPLRAILNIHNSNSLGQKLESILVREQSMQVGGANIFPIVFNESGFTNNLGMPAFIYVEVFLWFNDTAVSEPFVIKFTIDRPPVIPKGKPSILQKALGGLAILGTLSLLGSKR